MFDADGAKGGALVGNVIGGLTVVAAVTALAAYGQRWSSPAVRQQCSPHGW